MLFHLPCPRGLFGAFVAEGRGKGFVGFMFQVSTVPTEGTLWGKKFKNQKQFLFGTG